MVFSKKWNNIFANSVYLIHFVVPHSVTAPANRKLPFENSRSFWDRLKGPFTPGRRPLIVELLMKTYDIPVAMLNEFRIVASRPDILVRPQLDPDLKVEDFKRIDEAVEAGYHAANDVLDTSELTRDS